MDGKLKALPEVMEEYAAAKAREAEKRQAEEPGVPSWPVLREEALYGLAGRVVKAIAPQTEADPAALLIQLLAGFGNAAGPCPYCVAEADRHGTNLYIVLVGTTSKGRKGTAWGHVRRILAGAAPDWSRRILSGLSSGEGVIWAVRDAITKTRPVKEKGHYTGATETVTEDQGERDKRLLVYEAEFANTLRVLDREGNTLSAVLRQAWDDGNLQTLTTGRNVSPVRATGAHVSIIGHVTKDELWRYLDRTEAANGFGNRFLWCCVRRSQFLPFGGKVDPAALASLGAEMGRSLDFARGTGELGLTSEACDVWRAVYPTLADGRPGLLGAMISRAEAQTRRLACLYALLDRELVVRAPHLEAALALWQYAEDSARYIFGESLGDPLADEILRALKATGTDGMTRTELSGWLQRHRRAGEIGRALLSLQECGKVRCETRKDTGGRPEERWFSL